MDIGPEKEKIVVEPLKSPVPQRDPAPQRGPVPSREPAAPEREREPVEARLAEVVSQLAEVAEVLASGDPVVVDHVTAILLYPDDLPEQLAFAQTRSDVRQAPQLHALRARMRQLHLDPALRSDILAQARKHGADRWIVALAGAKRRPCTGTARTRTHSYRRVSRPRRRAARRRTTSRASSSADPPGPAHRALAQMSIAGQTRHEREASPYPRGGMRSCRR